MKTNLITMENASLTFNHRQRVTAWLREHIPSVHSSRVSHTKVKVLARTQVTVPKGPVSDRSLFDRPLDGKWTKALPGVRRDFESKRCIKRNPTPAADETFHITSRMQGGKEDDEDTAPSFCLCSPLKMPIRRWRRRRQSQVVPLSSPHFLNNNIIVMKVHGEEAIPVTPMPPDITPFCLGNGTTQKNPTPEGAANAPQQGIPNLFGLVTTEMDTSEQDSNPTILEVVSNDMETRGKISPISREMAITVKDPSLQKHESISEVVPALSVDYQQAKTTKMSPNGDHVVCDLSRESIDSLRPKTSRGSKQDLDLVFPTERIRGEDSMVNVWTTEENKQDHIDSDDQNLVVSPGLEIKKTCNVLSDESNTDANKNESNGENPESSDMADFEISKDENDTWEQIEEAVAASRMSSRINVEKQWDELRELSPGEESGNNDVGPRDIQYELNQREQWQLAAIGEWSVICQGDDEVDEDDSQSYCMKDEFQKEQEIREDWRLILDRYQSLGIIQDLRTMQTLSKCTISQSERAMRQFARLCRGPVPLSHSGQTKTEAIASLSKKLHQQTKQISEEISNTFMDFFHIFEEIDALREMQDRVEDFFHKDLKKRDSEKLRASSPPRSATPIRRSASRLHQWEVDMDLMDIYTEGKVKSSSLITVMPTIGENDIYFVPGKRSSSPLSWQSGECQESDNSDDFPEYKGMDYVSPGESDVTPVDDTNNRGDDATLNKSTEDSVKRDER